MMSMGMWDELDMLHFRELLSILTLSSSSILQIHPVCSF
jgi:hypothetical protein